MTSSNPPYPYFNGITYNPSFFPSSSSSSSTGLTQTVADTLYLKKTVADTATSLETFSGGIKTNSIDATGTLLLGSTGTTNITMGATGTTTTQNGTLNIGTLALTGTGGLSLGTANNITLASTIPTDSSVLNTFTDIIGSTTVQTVNLTLLGQTNVIYSSTNIAVSSNATSTVHRTTISKSGVYTLVYQLNPGTIDATLVANQSIFWISISSPTLYSGKRLGNSTYLLTPSMYLDYFPPYSSSWTGFINAGATVNTNCILNTQGTGTPYITGDYGNNYFSITRIA